MATWSHGTAPPPTGPGVTSTARNLLRGISTYLHYHLIPLFPSSPGRHCTSPLTNASLVLVQSQKLCSLTSHPRRGDTRSRSCASTSPPAGTILCNPSSRPQVYRGSMAAHDWFPEIFGTLDTCATLLTLVTSHVHPSPHGATPGDLSSLGALPLT